MRKAALIDFFTIDSFAIGSFIIGILVIQPALGCGVESPSRPGTGSKSPLVSEGVHAESNESGAAGKASSESLTDHAVKKDDRWEKVKERLKKVQPDRSPKS